jgi:protein-S-isoprenylcysteine O-methyltransferase Ste14
MGSTAIMALVKQTILSSFMLSIMLTVFCVSAGSFHIQRLWLFAGIAFIYFLGSNIALYKLNPGLLIQRLKIRRKGSKTWDEVLVRVSNLSAMILVPAVSGLDVGRYHWSHLGYSYVLVGAVLLVASSVLINWAMVVNPFFEPTVRIQNDREHRVISSGPYAYVRHPGYLSGIMWMTSVPLILGSLYGFIPVAFYSILMTIRTYLEDRALRKELPGYVEYSESVRYRLFPGIW